MTEQENRAESNLLLMCLPHSAEIDEELRVEDYPPETLLRYKSNQIALRDQIQQDWDLSPVETAEVVERSFGGPPAVHIWQLGGHGGQAMSAGGGGGAAFGDNATGGPGGRGGDVTHIYRVDGESATDPGAGGGGGAAMKVADFSEMPEAALEGICYVPSFDGLPGGDTTLSIGDTVLLKAEGGKFDTGPRDTSAEIYLSAVLLVNQGTRSENLAFVHGAGCSHYQVLNVPEAISFSIYLCIDAPLVPVGRYTIKIEFVGPNENRQLVAQFPLQVDVMGVVSRHSMFVTPTVQVDQTGVWRVEVSSEVRRLGSAGLIIARTI